MKRLFLEKLVPHLMLPRNYLRLLPVERTHSRQLYSFEEKGTEQTCFHFFSILFGSFNWGDANAFYGVISTSSTFLILVLFLLDLTYIESGSSFNICDNIVKVISMNNVSYSLDVLIEPAVLYYSYVLQSLQDSLAFFSFNWKCLLDF